jgi:transposase
MSGTEADIRDLPLRVNRELTASGNCRPQPGIGGTEMTAPKRPLATCATLFTNRAKIDRHNAWRHILVRESARSSLTLLTGAGLASAIICVAAPNSGNQVLVPGAIFGITIVSYFALIEGYRAPFRFLAFLCACSASYPLSIFGAFGNAMAESFFASLERELLNRRRFKSQAEAKMAVFELGHFDKALGFRRRRFLRLEIASRLWVRQDKRDAGKGDGGLTSAEREELTRLRRENRKLKEEREILSKAAAWFATESGTSKRSSGS